MQAQPDPPQLTSEQPARGESEIDCPAPRAPAPGKTRRWALDWWPFALLLGLQAVCLVLQEVPFHEDDAAFYFRYAENLAAGHGWRWNVEEPPVWGASSPFWPLPLALGVKLGLTVQLASALTSWFFALGATFVLGLVAQRAAGALGVLALAPLLAINHLYSTWATSGIESPLTFFWIALALLVATRPVPGWLLGFVAGMCLVHKVDLAPLGVVLLFGALLWRRRELRSALPVALGIAVAWYGFAAWYFGAPLPNSFLTKLHATYGGVGRGWFFESVALVGLGPLRSLLALLGLYVLRHRPFLVLVAASSVLIPALGYTLRPPPEPFMWYVSAAAPALALLAACGLARVLEALAGARPWSARVALVPALLVVVGSLGFALEYPLVRRWHGFLAFVEPHRIQSGQWVARHSPADARVITNWGNPAYHSRRFVYDGSFLNRPYEEGDLREKYRPEVILTIPTGPEQYEPPRGYRLERQFLPRNPQAWEHGSLVLFRDDVAVVGEVDPSIGSPPTDLLAPRRQELVQRLLAGEAVDTSEVEYKLLASVKPTVDMLVRRLAELPEDERRALLVQYPGLADLRARYKELLLASRKR